MSYNRRIKIQEKTIQPDDYGEPIETWETRSTVWASVVTTGGGEFYAAQKLNASTEVLFKMRYGNRVNVLNRILYNGRTFEILSINDVDEAHIEIRLSAKEVV